MLFCGRVFAALTPRLEPRIGLVAEAFFISTSSLGLAFGAPEMVAIFFYGFLRSLWGLAFDDDFAACVIGTSASPLPEVNKQKKTSGRL